MYKKYPELVSYDHIIQHILNVTAKYLSNYVLAIFSGTFKKYCLFTGKENCSYIFQYTLKELNLF